jgi:hypothetical protein
LAILLVQIAINSFATNPIVPGYYADSEIRIFDGQYWIYPTWSASEDTPVDPVNFTSSQIAQRAQPDIWAPFLGHH